VLFLLGPAGAFSFVLGVDDSVVVLGGVVSFLAEVNVSAGELLPVRNITFLVLGPSNVSCSFLPNGSVISGCGNVSVVPLFLGSVSFGILSGVFGNVTHSFGYGYGYGFDGPQVLLFNISFNSSLLSVGNYSSRLITWMDSSVFVHVGDNFSVVSASVTTVLLLAPSDVCTLPDENVTLFANVSGDVVNVTFAARLNGSWTNFSLPFVGGGVYSHVLVPSQLIEGVQVSYQFLALNSLGVWVSSNITKQTVHFATHLVVDPVSPDGLSSWYVTQPNFTVSNTDPGLTLLFYRWNATGIFNSSSTPFSFNLSNAPNNAGVTGGNHTLWFWSNVCNESNQSRSLLFDFKSPIITSLFPPNNTVLNGVPRPVVSALLDEVFANNSGVNKSFYGVEWGWSERFSG